jgi:membrane associated rhomboid family serine protease
LRRLASSVMRATYFLILAEIAAYFLVSFNPPAAFSYLGFSTSGFLQGQFWMPVTSMFVHVDLFHLGTNLLFLYIFGIALEERIGALRTMVIFFTAGILSLFAGVPFYSPDTHIVGSSIAVSALVGAAVVLAPSRSSPLTLFAPLGLVATIYLIFNTFMLTVDQTGGVAYQSHVIGFSIGLILGFAWRKRRTLSERAPAENVMPSQRRV